MAEAARPRYFPVSASKFVVMSLASFGIYGFYWLYENWVLERALLVVVPLVPVQRSVNRLNAVGAPAAPKNDTYTGMNLVLIVVGLIFYGPVIIGLMAPVENETYPLSAGMKRLPRSGFHAHGIVQELGSKVGAVWPDEGSKLGMNRELLEVFEV